MTVHITFSTKSPYIDKNVTYRDVIYTYIEVGFYCLVCRAGVPMDDYVQKFRIDYIDDIRERANGN